MVDLNLYLLRELYWYTYTPTQSDSENTQNTYRVFQHLLRGMGPRATTSTTTLTEACEAGERVAWAAQRVLKHAW